MDVTANCYLNKRIGLPDTTAINPGYLSPGTQMTIESVVTGKEIEGIVFGTREQMDTFIGVEALLKPNLQYRQLISFPFLQLNK